MTKFRITLSLLALIVPAVSAASLGKDTRYIHAHRSPGRGLSGSVGSPSRTLAHDLQSVLDLFDDNKCGAGCVATEILLKTRLLTSEELAHLRSAVQKQSPELFDLVCRLQQERTIIDDLTNKRTHAKISGLDSIMALSNQDLADFSAPSFKEIDLLTSELEASDNEEIMEKAKEVRIKLAHALIEQNRALDRE